MIEMKLILTFTTHEFDIEFDWVGWKKMRYVICFLYYSVTSSKTNWS